TVKAPTPAKLRNMIDVITARIRDDGQFDECNITFGELNIVAESFVKVLTGIHHHRIEYPGYDFNNPGPQSEGLAVPLTTGEMAAVPPSSEKPNLEEARGD
ncbi:MAG TPA: hypothetical protein VJX67_04390, partial [Blastocatellia bacterium]|nr:hypothetical protein [Blastocatellia bacterium]